MSLPVGYVEHSELNQEAAERGKQSTLRYGMPSTAGSKHEIAKTSMFLCLTITRRAQSGLRESTAWDAYLSELTCLAYVLNSGDAAYFSATASAAICAA